MGTRNSPAMQRLLDWLSQQPNGRIDHPDSLTVIAEATDSNRRAVKQLVRGARISGLVEITASKGAGTTAVWLTEAGINGRTTVTSKPHTTVGVNGNRTSPPPGSENAPEPSVRESKAIDTTDELAAARAQINALQAELAETVQAFHDAQHSVSSLRAEADALREQAQSGTLAELKEARDTIAELKKELQLLEDSNAVDDPDDVEPGRRKKSSPARRAKEQQVAVAAMLPRGEEALQRTVRAQAAEIQSLTSTRERLRLQVAQLQAANPDVAALHARIRELERKRDDLQAHVDKVEREKSRVLDSFAAAKREAEEATRLAESIRRRGR